MSKSNFFNAPNITDRPWVVFRSSLDEGRKHVEALAPSVGHETELVALAEAQRLALFNPNSLFYVAKVTNGFQSQVIAMPLIELPSEDIF